MTRFGCEDVGPRLEAWRDGLVDSEERSHIDQHLAECPSCAEELAFSDALSPELFPQHTLDVAHLVQAGAWRDAPAILRPSWRRPAGIGSLVAAAAGLLVAAGLALAPNPAQDDLQSPAPRVFGSDASEGTSSGSQGSSSSGSSAGDDGKPASVEIEGENVTVNAGKDGVSSSAGTSGTSGSPGSASPGTSGSE